MQRSVNELDIRGFQIITFQDGKELSHPSYDPVWATATKLDVPIFLHPNGYPEGERLKNHYFINIIVSTPLIWKINHLQISNIWLDN